MDRSNKLLKWINEARALMKKQNRKAHTPKRSPAALLTPIG